jgi:hypothetical protein
MKEQRGTVLKSLLNLGPIAQYIPEEVCLGPRGVLEE